MEQPVDQQQQYYQQGYQQPPQQGYAGGPPPGHYAGGPAPNGYGPPNGYAPPNGGYPGGYNTQPAGPIPEWRRIMLEDLFTFNLPCVAGFFAPNIVGAITMYRLRGTCDAIITCCCFPCVCCCNRTAVKSAVGIDLNQDSCFVNCLLHYFCHCFAVGQEYNAIASLHSYITMYGPGSVPGAPTMNTI